MTGILFARKEVIVRYTQVMALAATVEVSAEGLDPGEEVGKRGRCLLPVRLEWCSRRRAGT